MLIRHINGFFLYYYAWNELTNEEKKSIKNSGLRYWGGEIDCYWRFDNNPIEVLKGWKLTNKWADDAIEIFDWK